MSAPPRLLDHFEPLAAAYDVVLCDVWGVIHNSLEAAPEAHDALSRFRARGGAAVLITNAPRPGEAVKRQLDRLGVPTSAYDGIVSSGEVTRALMRERHGGAVFHIGPERDRPLFDGLGITFAAAEAADYVVCTGLFDDESEAPEDYRALFTALRARDRFMLCANPDIVVERGTKLIYCAGALAELYQSLGGEVAYAGKPHAPIYRDALAKAATVRGKEVPQYRVLAIGDSLRTDMKGAHAFGIDSLFVTAGIHAEELGSREDPDAAALTAAFAKAGVTPTAIMRRLVW